MGAAAGTAGASAALGAAGAVVGGITSLFGGRARRKEEKVAQGQFNNAQGAYDDYQFQNNYLGLENTAEDLTVNQQAAEFQRQSNQQGLAQGLDAITQSGIGGGGAQAIANASLESSAGLSNSIAQQEQANQQARIAQASRNQLLERQGAERQQDQQFNRITNQYGIASNRLGAAKDARAQATNQLIGGVIGAGVAGAGAGLFGDKAQNFITGDRNVPGSVNALSPRPNKLIGDPVAGNIQNPRVLTNLNQL